MAKKERCVYGVNEPTSINQLNNDYMLAFIQAKKEDGTIDEKALKKFKADAKKANESGNTAISISREVRRAFASAFMPGLLPKTKKVDFFAELDKI